MVFWLQASREFQICSAPFLQFLRKLGSQDGHNFHSYILVILPKNQCKSPTNPIRQLSLSSRILLPWGGFSFFLKCCHYFRDITFETLLLATPYNSMFFLTLAPAIWAPTIWPPLKSDRSDVLMNFDLFLQVIAVKNNNFHELRREKSIKKKKRLMFLLDTMFLCVSIILSNPLYIYIHIYI